MILLVVPLGFSTGTELLKTRAQRSQIDFPIVNFEPPASDREKAGETEKETQKETIDLSNHKRKVLLKAFYC